MARVQCLYCDAENDALATGGYCDSCGKKLPSSALVRTRRSLAGEVPSMEEQAPRRAKSLVAEALQVAAVVHLVVGGLFMMVGPALFSRVPENFLSLVLTWTLIPSLLVGLLSLWASSAPQAAAMAALLAALAWIAATFALEATMALRWLIVDGVFLALLVRAAWLTRAIGNRHHE